MEFRNKIQNSKQPNKTPAESHRHLSGLSLLVNFLGSRLRERKQITPAWGSNSLDTTGQPMENMMPLKLASCDCFWRMQLGERHIIIYI